MLPNRALIVCDTPEEAYSLLQFLESTGEVYWNYEGRQMYYESCWSYKDREEQLCYCLDHGRVGFCNTSWFKESMQRSYLNDEDPSWNFISVDEFITRCGGSVKNETEISLEGLI